MSFDLIEYHITAGLLLGVNQTSHEQIISIIQQQQIAQWNKRQKAQIT